MFQKGDSMNELAVPQGGIDGIDMMIRVLVSDGVVDCEFQPLFDCMA